MSDDARIEADRQLLIEAQEKGGLAKLATYVKLSGPGWLQSALTLGGGSLGSSLYLGILAGVSMIWLQPFAMILGVIMLSAISYVTLSTGERPFRAINQHINPVLGWSWLIASLMANMVWSMPQYSLCFAVLEQNLLPGVFSGDGPLSVSQSGDFGKWAVSIAILVFCTLITWSYGSGSVGVKIYEAVLKVVVAVIVLCFFGVVIRMSLVGDGINWAAVWNGLIPKWKHLFEPSDTFKPLLDAIIDPAARAYWSANLVSQQRDVMLSAGAAAVGINMTFLLPYNMLSSGWNKDFRGLAIFDMSTGMFVPFVLATSCIVIASATQFHAQLPAGTTVGTTVQVPERMADNYGKLIASRNEAAQKEGSELSAKPSLEEAKLAAVLVKRDTYDLANSLKQLFADENGEGGSLFSNIIFGVGVVGMTLSSISLMMLISGFVVCEVFNIPPKGWIFRLGCLASATGVLWPWIWASGGGAKAWMTVVAGVFGSMLLPIAYVTFYLMMNQESLLGENRPQGFKRLVWNVLMAIAAIAASAAGVSAVYKKCEEYGYGSTGLGFIAAYIVVVLSVQFLRKPDAVKV